MVELSDGQIVRWSDGRTVGWSGHLVEWSDGQKGGESYGRMVGYLDSRTFGRLDGCRVGWPAGRMVGLLDGRNGRLGRLSDIRSVGRYYGRMATQSDGRMDIWSDGRMSDGRMVGQPEARMVGWSGSSDGSTYGWSADYAAVGVLDGRKVG